MVKHNNIIPNQHFRKWWARHVRTWFDQPARKERRRNARVTKAKALAPRPLQSLRPIVRGSTNKYNNRVRAGRGFTLDELEAAKIGRKEARTIGIAVDHRRKNRSEESLKLNVARLKAYKARLVVFPRKPSSKRTKAGDATKADQKKAVQIQDKDVLPIKAPQVHTPARKITAAEREATVTNVLRKALTDAKLAGVRAKRAADKAKAPKPKEKPVAEADE